MNPNTGEPVNPPPSPNPLADLEDVVAAAQQEVAARAVSIQTSAEEFKAQFGSGVTPPVTEIPSSSEPSVASLDPSINTVDDLLVKGPQVVEAVAPPEQTPAEKLKKQISDSVDAFLEEVTKEKITA